MLKCQVCLEEDEDVRPYRNDESGLTPGNYHIDCALIVGFNEWDEGQ